MAVHNKTLPCLPVGSNFFSLNRLDKSPESRFASHSMWVRSTRETDYTKGSALLKRLQGRSPTLNFSQTERLLLLEAYILGGQEEELSKIFHILGKQCDDMFHVDVPKAIAHAILSTTLPSGKQTVLWASLLSQWKFCQPYLKSGNRREGMKHVQARLFGAALAACRWPKSKQSLLDTLELALHEPPPCPFRHPDVDYWDGWFDPVHIPACIRKDCLVYTDQAVRLIGQKFPLEEYIESRSATGYATTTNLASATFRPSSKHQEALLEQARQPKLSPLYDADTRKRFIPSVFSSNERRLGDELTYKEAFQGLVRFLALYQACRYYAPKVKDDALGDHSLACDTLWRLVRYLLAILVHPERSSPWAVLLLDHDKHAHPFTRMVSTWHDDWRRHYADMEASGTMNVHDLPSIIMARLAKTSHRLLQKVSQTSHPFFRHPASLVWGVLFSLSHTHMDRLHLAILCEAWLEGLVEEHDHWSLLISAIRFMSEPTWHAPNETMTGDAERASSEDTTSTGSEDDTKDNGRSYVEPLALVDLEAPHATSSLVPFGHQDHDYAYNDMVSLGGSVQDLVVHGKPTGGYLGGYVDLVCRWVLVPASPPPTLFGRPFAAAMESQLVMAGLASPLMIVPDILMDLEAPSFVHTLLDRSWPEGVQPILGPHLLYLDIPKERVELADEVLAMEKQIQVGIHWNGALLAESLNLRTRSRGEIDLDDAMVLATFSYRGLARNLGDVFGRSWSGAPLVWHVPRCRGPLDFGDGHKNEGPILALEDEDEMAAYAKKIVEAWRRRDKKPPPPTAYHLPDVTAHHSFVDPFDSDEEHVESNRRYQAECNKELGKFMPDEGDDTQLRITLQDQIRLGISGNSGRYIRPSTSSDRSYAKAYEYVNVKRIAKGLPPLREHPSLYEEVQNGKTDKELTYGDEVLYEADEDEPEFYYVHSARKRLARIDEGDDGSNDGSNDDDESGGEDTGEPDTREPAVVPPPGITYVEMNPRSPPEKRKRPPCRHSSRLASAAAKSKTKIAPPTNAHIQHYVKDLPAPTVSTPPKGSKPKKRRILQEWKEFCNTTIEFRPFHGDASNPLRVLAYDLKAFPIVLARTNPDIRASLLFSGSRWYWVQAFPKVKHHEDPFLGLWYHCASLVWAHWSTGGSVSGPQMWKDSNGFYAALPLPADRSGTMVSQSYAAMGYTFMTQAPGSPKAVDASGPFFASLSAIYTISSESKERFYAMLYWLILPRAFGYLASAKGMGILKTSAKEVPDSLIPVTWDLKAVDDDEDVQDLVAFFFGSATYTRYVDDPYLHNSLGKLVGVERDGTANNTRLDYIKDIFAEAYGLGPALGLEVAPSALTTFARLRAQLK